LQDQEDDCGGNRIHLTNNSEAITLVTCRTLGSTKTYYKRTSGKHVKAEPNKEEWESLNRNGALEFYI
jgi:hypothetical protein